MKTCSKRDCKRRYFFKEAVRWVKQALADTGECVIILLLTERLIPLNWLLGIFIYENRLAAAALFIGASVLITMMITSGALIPTALQVVGFGVKGPIAGKPGS